jgi:hypothetical protein
MSQLRTLGLALVFGLAAACGGSDSAPAPTPTPTPTPEATPQTMQQAAEQMAKGMEQFAKGLSGQGQGEAAKAVDFERLVELLPQVDGWERSEPKGEQVTMGIAISKAQARYTKGGSEVSIEITDSSFNQLILTPLSMYLAAGYSERSTEGFKRGTTVGGHPGFETWVNSSKRGEVTAVVANRFIVQGTGRGVENTDAVKAFVQAVDLSKLAGLK